MGNAPSDSQPSTSQIIFASTVSKIVATCIAYPHEVLRSRLQDTGHAQHLHQQSSKSTTTFHEYTGVRDAITTIAREEGMRAFYRGLVPGLLRSVPAAVLTLSSYEKIKQFLGDHFSEVDIK